jgi:hypothetical protein
MYSIKQRIVLLPCQGEAYSIIWSSLSVSDGYQYLMVISIWWLSVSVSDGYQYLMVISISVWWLSVSVSDGYQYLMVISIWWLSVSDGYQYQCLMVEVWWLSLGSIQNNWNTSDNGFKLPNLLALFVFIVIFNKSSCTQYNIIW